MTLLSILVFGVVAVAMDIPWPPVAALLSIPLLIGVPIEVARHWDYLDAHLIAHSNREPGESE